MTDSIKVILDFSEVDFCGDGVVHGPNGRVATSVAVTDEGANLYACNPSKNHGCPKTSCFRIGGPCFLTSNTEAVYWDDEGSPKEGD